MLVIQVSLHNILNTLKTAKHDLFISTALGMTSFSFSNCTEERGIIHNLTIQLTSHPSNKCEQITRSCLLCVNYQIRLLEAALYQ